jgi:amino acid transporter
MDGVGYILAGKWGRELYSVVYPLFMIFLSGSGFVAISIAFNAVSTHATCTVAWVVVAMVGTFAMASIQTLNKVSILGWVGFVSVMSAILIITIAVGIQDRPVAAPQTGPWDKDIGVVNSAGTFLGGMGAVSTVVFSYSGTPAFFNVIGEMRRPQDYNRALYTCQTVVTATYLTIGIVVYYYCGQYLTNPALGSAGTLIKKIAYGIALPGLFVSVTIYTHVGAKMIFVRLLRGSEHLTTHSFTHWGVWLGTVAGCVAISFILAEGESFPRCTPLTFSHPILW